MSEIEGLFTAFRAGLDLDPVSSDDELVSLWKMSQTIAETAGLRLLEARMGASIAAADEVRMHLVRCERVTRLMRGMPLTVPRAAVRGLRAAGVLVESTSHRSEVLEYLYLLQPITDDLGAYAGRHLGYRGKPVIDGLMLTARSAQLMSTFVSQLVPPEVDA